MMNALLSYVREGISMELRLARRDNGPYFHSTHEGYGVLMEEVYEAKREIERLTSLSDSMLDLVHRNNDYSLKKGAEAIGVAATLAACELIQVAAMARKMRESIDVCCPQGGEQVDRQD